MSFGYIYFDLVSVYMQRYLGVFVISLCVSKEIIKTKEKEKEKKEADR